MNAVSIRTSLARRLGALVVLVALVALVGCGASKGMGTVAPSKDPKADFLGTWTAVSVSDKDLGDLTLEDMTGLGIYFRITLVEDGTGTMDLAGDVEDLKWSLKDDTTVLINDSETAASSLELKDGKLVGDEDGTKMVFEKGDLVKEDMPKGGGSTDDKASEAVDYLIADDELATIRMTEVFVDFTGDPGFVVNFKNNSDKSLRIWSQSESFSINGEMREPIGLFELTKPGTYVDCKVFYDGAEVGHELASLKDISGKIELMDEDYDVLRTYDFSYSYGAKG